MITLKCNVVVDKLYAITKSAAVVIETRFMSFHFNGYIRNIVV